MCLGEIVRLDTVDGDTGVGRVAGREVSIALVTLEDPVVAGDWVVAHSGFALQRLDPAEAADAVALRGDARSRPISLPPTSTPPTSTTPTRGQS